MAEWSEERKLAAKQAYKDRTQTLTKVEEFNGEEVPVVEADRATGMHKWEESDMVDSIINTIKILPPNMIKDGRHQIENIQAINCFKVTPELIDKAYANFKHDLD